MYEQNRLEDILVENAANIKRRESIVFDDMVNNFNQFIIFGCGALGKLTATGALKLGMDLACFADNNETLWNSKIGNLFVLSPAEALETYPNAVVIFCIWSASVGHPLEEVKKQINEIKKTTVVSFIFLYWKYPDTFLPYWRCELPHKTTDQFELVLAADELWADEFSRQEYFNQIYWRVYGDFNKLSPPVNIQQYFPDDILTIQDNEVFVDCGAFNGDTLESFLEKKADNKFSHYYAFEPDPENFKKLSLFVERLPKETQNKISIQQVAIGACEEDIYFQADSSIQSNVSENGNLVVKSYSIDSLKLNNPPTYLKMDVEGFEPNIIFGAKQTIKKFKPIIAISIYHKFDHLWRLPLTIHAFLDEYDFYLRPHFYAGWELVCYAIPKHRTEDKS